jgi:predicted transcriptional regulator
MKLQPAYDFKRRIYFQKIREVLSEKEGLSPNKISVKTGIQWRTVKTLLDVLEAEGAVKKQTVFREYRYSLEE